MTAGGRNGWRKAGAVTEIRIWRRSWHDAEVARRDERAATTVLQRRQHRSADPATGESAIRADAASRISRRRLHPRQTATARSSWIFCVLRAQSTRSLVGSPTCHPRIMGSGFRRSAVCFGRSDQPRNGTSSAARYAALSDGSSMIAPRSTSANSNSRQQPKPTRRRAQLLVEHRPR